jgi:hypothetical protein
MVPTPPWTVVYADGSANVYRLAADGSRVRVTYEPITPAMSSSGTYSGGDPLDMEVPASDPRIAKLWHLLGELEADRANHMAERNKGDGAVTVTTSVGTRRFLVARAATRAIEGFLAKHVRGVID